MQQKPSDSDRKVAEIIKKTAEQTYLDKLARRLGLNDSDVADMNAGLNP